MKILDWVEQGSEDWKKERSFRFCASEAPAMMGCSKYMKRDELLRMKATGDEKTVSATEQMLYDEGHAAEVAARLIVEKMIGDELFPVTAVSDDNDRMLASFDGVNMMEDTIWEHKLWQKELVSSVRDGVLPETHVYQVEHQLLVSNADKCIFTVSDGTEDNMVHLEYESNPDCRKKLIAGWKQFAEDLKNWKPQEVIIEPVGNDVEELPTLNVKIEGGVTSTNLITYQRKALAFIQSISTDLQTDQDFADADKLVKFCNRAEKELERVKKDALDQTADIADLFSTIDELKEEMRSKRLELNKLVKARKAAIKEAIATDAHSEYSNFICELDASFGNSCINIESVSLNLESAMKNKRTVESLRNAANTELARCKIIINEQADFMRGNFDALQEVAGEYGFLFSDIQQIIRKEREDLLNLAKQRIAEHKAEEERKLEAERERKRIAEEAAERAKREAEKKIAREKAEAKRREREAIEAKERAEREAIEAKERAEREAWEAKVMAESRAKKAKIQAEKDAKLAVEIERARAKAEQERVKREAKAREADVEHKRTVNNEALSGLIAAGMEKDAAKNVIEAIAAGAIPHVRINY